jgi:chemotaxis regulatin CheY-phosphate phosphatase CheZ
MKPWTAGDERPRDRDAREPFITVPARARDEIGKLTYYLEQSLRNLHDVQEHVREGSGTMPIVLDDLTDVMRMTEAATLQVLDETEALVDDGRTAVRLLAKAEEGARAAGLATLTAPMREVAALVERSTTRAIAIMCALEFHDLTNQKVTRTFGMLEEVLLRLGEIHRLVDAGDATPAPVAPAKPAWSVDEVKSAQFLADELLMGFAREVGG